MTAHLDLNQLFFALRDSGFNVGPENLLDAERLRLHLLEQGRYPQDPARLKFLLAPVFSSDPAEQAEFYRLFEHWQRRGDPKTRDEDTTSKAPAEKSRAFRQRARSAAKARRIPTFVVVIGLCFVLGIGAFEVAIKPFLESLFDNSPVVEKPGDSSPISTDPALQQSEPQEPESAGPEDIRQVAVQANEALRRDRLNWQERVGRQRVDFIEQTLADREYKAQWLKLVMVLVPLILYARWLYLRHSRQRFWLDRFRADKHPTLSRLKVALDRDYLFRGAQFARAAQKLRRQVQYPSQDLDIDGTLRATIDQMGLWTPVYGTRGQVPEYLFLIDRYSVKDQWASLSSSYTTELQNQGVHLDTYHFYRDPRDCYGQGPAGAEQHWQLKQLLAAHPNHRLVVMTDANQFVDALNFQLRPGLQQLQQWSYRVLVTPRAFGEWGDRERSLWRLGWLVVPATDTGIKFFSESLALDAQDGDWRPGLPGWLTSLPSLPAGLRDEEDIWFDEEPKADAQQLVADLRQYFDEFTFQWWAACSIYPELDWHLTLFLGAELARARGMPEPPDVIQTATLLRLPWFRRGTLPQYLRVLFLSQLDKGYQTACREALQRLLQTALLDPEAGFELDIATGLPDRQWRRMFDDYFASRAAVGGDLDTIFVGFMAGRDPSRTGLTIDQRIKRWLGTPVNRKLSFKPLALGALTFGFCWSAIVYDDYRLILDDVKLFDSDVSRLAISPGGQLLAAISGGEVDESIRLRPLSGSPVALTSPKWRPRALTFSPVSLSMAVGVESGSVYLWNLVESTNESYQVHKSAVTGLTYSRDGALLASVDEDNAAFLWFLDSAGDTGAATTLRRDPIPLGQTGFSPTSIDISPDGKQVVLGGGDGSVQLVSIETMESQSLEGQGAAVTSVAFSPSGRLLASGSLGHIVRLWDTETRAVAEILTQNTGPIKKVMFSPGGQLLASVAAGEICLWRRDGQLIGKKCLVSEFDPDDFSDAAFHPDGRSIIYATRGFLRGLSLVDESLAATAYDAVVENLRDASSGSFDAYSGVGEKPGFLHDLELAQAGLGVAPIVDAAVQQVTFNSVYAIGRMGRLTNYREPGKSPTSPALAYLLSHASNEDAAIRSAVAWALGRIGYKYNGEAIAVLLRLVNDADEAVTQSALQALADMGANTEEVERNLLSFADTASDTRRLNLQLAGARLGFDSLSDLGVKTPGIPAGARVNLRIGQRETVGPFTFSLTDCCLLIDNRSLATRLSVRPVSLSPTVKSFSLAGREQSVVYRHGPSISRTIELTPTGTTELRHRAEAISGDKVPYEIRLSLRVPEQPAFTLTLTGATSESTELKNFHDLLKRGDTAFAKKSFKTAMAHYIEAAELAESLFGADSVEVAEIYMKRARCLIGLGTYALAESQLNKSRKALATLDRSESSSQLRRQLAILEKELLGLTGRDREDAVQQQPPPRQQQQQQQQLDYRERSRY